MSRIPVSIRENRDSNERPRTSFRSARSWRLISCLVPRRAHTPRRAGSDHAISSVGNDAVRETNSGVADVRQPQKSPVEHCPLTKSTVRTYNSCRFSFLMFSRIRMSHETTGLAVASGEFCRESAQARAADIWVISASGQSRVSRWLAPGSSCVRTLGMNSCARARAPWGPPR